MLLQAILQPVASVLPFISIASLAAGGYVGRRFCLAGSCKFLASVACLMGKTSAASWEKTSQDYWTLAKRDAVRDLTAVAGFIVLGLASGYAGKIFSEPEEEPEEKRGIFIKLGVEGAKFIQEYQKSILIFASLGTTWKCRRFIAKNEPLTKIIDLGLVGLETADAIVNSQIFNARFYPCNIIFDSVIAQIIPVFKGMHACVNGFEMYMTTD